jgi:preprotein translocase subunit SecA
MSFLDRFFGPTYEKELKSIKPLVTAINERESTLQDMSADNVRAYSDELKQRVAHGETLDEVLVDAFALVREASRQTTGLRPYDVQLIGAILLHRGKIAEMRTGEGKTLVGTFPGYLNALLGDGVHVITVNDYLARRDAAWMGQVYHQLGMTVGVINQGESYLYDADHMDKDAERDESGAYKVVYDFLRPCSRQEAYAADITYGTNSEFGFDYLRDNIEFEVANLRQRGHAYAIVDEIDSILIDEARTPLIISAPASESENLYELFANIARNLQPETHFTVDEKMKSATLTNAGIEAAQKMLGVDNIYTDKGIKYVHHLETAVRAQALYTNDKEYVVRDGNVVIVDEFTGRLQPGRRWSEGLHQAIEAKEGVPVQQESKTYASITYQNYFRMYQKLAGMTGTAITSQEEFYSVYGLDVVPIPTNKPVQRTDHPDAIFQNEQGKFKAIVNRVQSLHEKGQPVLIGTASIEVNERLSNELTRAQVPHQVLNAKQHEQEGGVIAAAGAKGAVTLATNMAGRGVDIKLGGPNATSEQEQEVIELGGLFVLGTERHEARRIDNQLRGRAGRQGDPGETQFFVSMEDNLMRVFGGERVQRMMGTFSIPEDQPIEMKMLSRQLESAQTRIEGFHFDSRKQILAYDDVLNQQRATVYERRYKILHGERDALERLLDEVCAAYPSAVEAITAKREEVGEENFFELFRRLSLQMIDTLWVEHLEVMGYTRNSVNLRAYGQRDPLIEYRKEGKRLFHEMQGALLYRIAHTLPQVQLEAIQKQEEEQKAEREKITRSDQASSAAAAEVQKPKVKERTYGRNELVTITDGTREQQLKYKKAEPLLASGWQIVDKSK